MSSVIQSLIISWLVYWVMCSNMGLPLKSVQKLQFVQSVAMWKFWGPPRLNPIELLLRELHWLSICFRVQFKGLVITFKALQDLGPSYLSDHLTTLELAHTTYPSRGGMLRDPSAYSGRRGPGRKPFLLMLLSSETSCSPMWGWPQPCCLFIRA